MPQPFDYSLKIQSPGEAFLQAVQVGQQQQQVEAQRLRAETERKKIEDEATRAKNFQDALGATIRKPSAQAWVDLYSNYPSEYAQITEIRKNTSPAKSNLFSSTAVKLLQLDQTGDQAGIDKLLADTSAAIDAGIAAGSIDADTAKQFADMSNTYRTIKDPEARRGTISGLLAVYADKDQFDRVSKVLGLDMPAPLAEYQARLRKDGKEAADTWWKLESGKFLTTDDAFINVEEYLKRGGPITGAPAPKGVTFTPVKAPEGGQTADPSGNFPGK